MGIVLDTVRRRAKVEVVARHSHFDGCNNHPGPDHLGHHNGGPDVCHMQQRWAPVGIAAKTAWLLQTYLLPTAEVAGHFPRPGWVVRRGRTLQRDQVKCRG